MLVSAKGFSLVEILVVMAIVGIITTTGFMVLQKSLKDAHLQNEFTHLKQLIKKYAKQSLTSQMPIQISFLHSSSNTTASIYSMDETDYSRFNKTDCDNIDSEDSLKHDKISESNDTFQNIFIKACDGSSDIDIKGKIISICFSGRGGFEDVVTVYFLPYQDLSCGILSTVTKPNQRKLTLHTSGYIDGVSKDKNFDSFNVESTSFSSGGMMPDKFGCNDGDEKNIQFNLSWNGFPAETTKYFAIIMDDPDVFPAYVHWSVFNISNFETKVDEDGVIGGSSITGLNDAMSKNYYGPCPPLGPKHNYATSVYALNGVMDESITDAPITRVEFESEFSSFILAIGTITSQYERK